METYLHKTERLLAYNEDWFFTLRHKKTIYHSMEYSEIVNLIKYDFLSGNIKDKHVLIERKFDSKQHIVLEKEHHFDMSLYLSTEKACYYSDLSVSAMTYDITSRGIELVVSNKYEIITPINIIIKAFSTFDDSQLKVVNAYTTPKYDFVNIQSGVPAANCNCEQKLFKVFSKDIEKAYLKLCEQ